MNMKKTLFTLLTLSLLISCRDFNKEAKNKGYNYLIEYQIDKQGNYTEQMYCEEYSLENGCVKANGVVFCGDFKIKEL